MFNPDALWQQLRHLTLSNQLLVAYSGGLDSQVLLYSLVQLRAQHPTLRLAAVHVHHGLSSHADEWADFTRQMCRHWEVPYTLRKLTLASDNLSLEAAARQARYQALAELLAENTCLLTAHTQNDQAETVLLQLVRGAGPRGLAAMPARAAFSKGFHLRPLLNFTRSQLQQYAVEQQLRWVEDESNYQLQFARNYIRHSVLPLLEQRWPSISKTLARSAQHCAETAELLSELAYQDLLKLKQATLNTLSIAQLQQLSYARQSNVLREWLKNLGFALPSTVKLQQIVQEVIYSRADAQPKVSWNGVEIRRFQDGLFALKPLPKPGRLPPLSWDLQRPLTLPYELGTLTVLPHPPSLAQLKQRAGQLTIRFRQGGEACRPLGRHGTHTLKKLFQEWQVPPWQRHQIPLLFSDDQLIAVIGYCQCEEYPQRIGDYQIVWQPSSAGSARSPAPE